MTTAEPAERAAWDRMPRETARAYDAFRRFRDLGPSRKVGTDQTSKNWSRRWDWRARAAAWDDELNMALDRERMDALRTMHDTHQRAGRMAMGKALAALNALQPGDIPPIAAARLLELGARLERSTLLVSVEDLQGRHPIDPAEDPWESIARELTGTS